MINRKIEEGRDMGRTISKSEGKIEIVTGIYFIIFLLLILFVQIQVKLYMISSAYVEDALAASNLASAVIDVREYGMTHVIQVASPDTAYERYRQALQYNLDLDENWICHNTDLIHGKVEVLRYEIYNVKNRDITVFSYGMEGTFVNQIPNGLGHVYTPDGVLVESTAIYSEISFPVRGILGMEIVGRKQKTVDIVRKDSQGGQR